MLYSTDDDDTSSNFTCSSIEDDDRPYDSPRSKDTETLARKIEKFKPKMQQKNSYRSRNSTTPKYATNKNAKQTKSSIPSRTPTTGSPNPSTPLNTNDSSNELLDALNKNMQEMSLLREQIGSITNELTLVLNCVQEVEKENQVLKQTLQENATKITALEQRVHHLENNNLEENNKNRIERIEVRQERTDREFRKKQLLIKGSALTYDADNLKTAVVAKLADLLKIPIPNLQRMNYKLFGREQKAILITVQHDADRLAFFAAARKIKPKNISVNEFLPPAKAKLMYELRKMKYEKQNLRSVFSLGGRVYVTYREKGDKFEINDLSDVILTQQINQNEENQQTEENAQNEENFQM